MPAWNATTRLVELMDATLDAAIALEYRFQGKTELDPTPYLNEIIQELVSWGLDDKEKFLNTTAVAKVQARMILRERDGVGSWESEGYDSIFIDANAELENLEAVAASADDGDVRKAKRFCLSLNSVGSNTAWNRLNRRLGLAA